MTLLACADQPEHQKLAAAKFIPYGPHQQGSAAALVDPARDGPNVPTAPENLRTACSMAASSGSTMSRS